MSRLQATVQSYSCCHLYSSGSIWSCLVCLQKKFSKYRLSLR